MRQERGKEKGRESVCTYVCTMNLFWGTMSDSI